MTSSIGVKIENNIDENNKKDKVVEEELIGSITNTSQKESNSVANKITDFIHIGSANPLANQIDLIHFVCMGLILFVSFVKVELIGQGHLFLTLGVLLP